MRALLLFATTIVASTIAISADDNPPSAESPKLIDHIQADSIITIGGSAGELLLSEEFTSQSESSSQTKQNQGSHNKLTTNEKKGRMGGYRVQVFSDGNAKSAKAEAYRRAGAIQSRFPGLRTYVSYSAPYWKVRVGDFRTPEEAASCAGQIRGAFPSYGREVRVTRDRVTIK